MPGRLLPAAFGFYVRAQSRTRWCVELLAGIAACLLQRRLHPGSSGVLPLILVPVALQIADGAALMAWGFWFTVSRLRRGESQVQVAAEMRRALKGGR